MKTAVIVAVVALVVIVVVVGAGIVYFFWQAHITQSDMHVTAGFRQPARYALALLESPESRHGDLVNAMALAKSSQANGADHRAMLMLEQSQLSISMYKDRESDRKALRMCLQAAHSLIEDQSEATHEAVDPCLTAVHDQLQEPPSHPR